MKLFYLAAATVNSQNFIIDSEFTNDELIEQSFGLKKKFARFANFYADEGMIGANLAPRIIKKYNRMIAKTVEKLENAACDQFPPPDHYNMTEIVGESFDTDSDRLNREGHGREFYFHSE